MSIDKETYYAIVGLIGYIEGGFGKAKGPLAEGLIARANEVARAFGEAEIETLEKETAE